jgi:hypothetical protein
VNCDLIDKVRRLRDHDTQIRGRLVPPDPSRDVDRAITTPGSDDAARWKEKYEESQIEFDELLRSKEKYKEAYRNVRKDLDDEKQLAFNTTQRMQDKLQHYKNELEELHTSHMRSVNDVGTGLQPISDQEFEKRIRSLHDEVCFLILTQSFCFALPLTFSIPGKWLVSEGLQAAYTR